MSVIQAAGAGETSSGFYSHSINQSLRMEEILPHIYTELMALVLVVIQKHGLSAFG